MVFPPVRQVRVEIEDDEEAAGLQHAVGSATAEVVRCGRLGRGEAEVDEVEARVCPGQLVGGAGAQVDPARVAEALTAVLDCFAGRV